MRACAILLGDTGRVALPKLTRASAAGTVEHTDVRHLSLYLPGMTAPGA